MSTRILGCQLGEDGSIVIEWLNEQEHTPQGGLMHQTVINMKGQKDWEQVGYYADELRQDLEELVAWFEKYRLGMVPGLG